MKFFFLKEWIILIGLDWIIVSYLVLVFDVLCMQFEFFLILMGLGESWGDDLDDLKYTFYKGVYLV